MAINKLHISDQYFKWSTYHIDIKKLTFVNAKNVKSLIESSALVDCYTSIEDVGTEYLKLLCESVHDIVLVNIDYNFLKNTSDLFSYSFLLGHIKNDNDIVTSLKHQIKQQLTSTLSQRPSSDSVLWVAGCSYTAGFGVDTTQRYANILADKLNMPMALLAVSGASILWAADQILRSDIRANDLVVWGITTPSRVDLSTSFTLKSIPISFYTDVPKDKQYWSLDFFESQTQSVHCQRQILQVINYCNKVGAKLVLVNFLDNAFTHLIFKNEQNYIDLSIPRSVDGSIFNFIDYGADNKHPGPQQHNYYAEQIFNLIKENNYGKTI